MYTFNLLQPHKWICSMIKVVETQYINTHANINIILLTLYTKTNCYADNNSAKHFNILIMLFFTLTLIQILVLLLILTVMPGIVTIKNYT